MTFDILIEREAWNELEESATWYEQQCKGLGTRFIDSFLSALDYIEIHPELFPVMEKDYRQAAMKTFPFVIIYKFSANQITIIAVFHTGRNPKKKFR